MEEELGMAREPTKNRVVLGYHSAADWMFFPEAVALYDQIVINQSAYQKVLSRGKGTSSTYRATKAELLKTLVQQGVLQPAKYPSVGVEQDQLDQLLDYFFRNHADAMRQLLAYAFDAFIQHERDTLEKLVAPEDPHWKDVASQLPRLERMRADLDTGAPLTDSPNLKEIAKRYFEDAIRTPIAFQTGYNPVFQWEGYAKFEQFLIKFRRGECAEGKSIQTGTELHVLRSLSDVIVPLRVVRSPDGVSQLVSKWGAFAEIRRYVSDLNRELWKMIRGASNVRLSEHKDFVGDFDSLLSARMETLNRQIKQVDLEIEKKHPSLSSRITRFLIATLGSAMPGSGGIGQILHEVHSAVIHKHVKTSYPGLSAVFEYERILSSIEVEPDSPISTSAIGSEYEAVEYWDQSSE